MSRSFRAFAAAALATSPAAAVGPLSFDVLWTHDTNSQVRGCPGLVGAPEGPLVIVGTDNGEILALNARGEVRWRAKIDGRAHGWPTTIDLPAGKTILIGDSDGTVHAFAPDGTLRWHVSLGNLSNADWGHSGISPWSGIAPLVGGGDAVLVVTDRKGRLSALREDGSIVWQIHLSERTHFPLIAMPAVGDLDGDGADEIVVSSFDGRIHCFGADASLRWVTPTMTNGEAGYHSPLIVDWGDGPRVLVLGDTDGQIRCLDGSGREVWRHQSTSCNIGLHCSVVPFRTNGQWRIFVGWSKTGQEILGTEGKVLRSLSFGGSSGLLFGPTVADLDGDGNPELLMPRIHHGTLRVLDADGNERANFELGGTTWGAPLIADIDRDGVPEFITVEAGNGQVIARKVRGALPGGEIQWPTSRGDFDGRRSRFTDTRRVRTLAPRAVGAARITRVEPEFIGTGKQHVRFASASLPDDSWVWVEATPPVGHRNVFVNRMDDPDHGWIAPFDPGTYTLKTRIQTADGAVLGETMERIPFVPFAREKQLAAAILQELSGLSGAAAPSVSHLISLRARQTLLELQAEQCLASGTEEEKRLLAEEGQKEIGRLRAELVRRRYAARTATQHTGQTTEIVAWDSGHPWVPFDPDTDTPQSDPNDTIRVTTDQRAHEATSVSVANLTGKTISVRVWLDPWKGGEEPPSSRAVTLRRRVFVATSRRGYTPDALPELDPSGVVTIPAGEALRLWLDWSSGDTPAGVYSSTLSMRALTVAGDVLRIPLQWEVSTVALPDSMPLAFRVWAYEQPAFFDRDAVWADLRAHYVNVYDIPVPTVRYNADGEITAEDWAAVEDVLRRAPSGSFFLWHGRETLVQPAEGAPASGSPAWEKAFRTFVPRWLDGLAARGLPPDRHANYILDEPGIDGGPSVYELIRIARLYKAADPRVRIFANPAGGATAQHVDDLNEVVDIFDPIMNFAHFERVLAKGKPTWTYECGDGAKDNTRMRYYWQPIWQGMEMGLSGLGIWSYAGRSVDFWQGTHDGCCDWELVYHGVGGSVIPSHRWQGVRIGIEDYARLWLLSRAADNPRGRGDNAHALELTRRKAAMIRQVLESGCDEGVVTRVRSQLRAILAEEIGHHRTERND